MVKRLYNDEINYRNRKKKIYLKNIHLVFSQKLIIMPKDYREIGKQN